jgi:hypothetical protein
MDVLFLLAEREGFEPSIGYSPMPDFESGTFNRSATSPKFCYLPGMPDLASAVPAALNIRCAHVSLRRNTPKGGELSSQVHSTTLPPLRKACILP